MTVSSINWTAVRLMGAFACLLASWAVALACTEEDQADIEQTAQETTRDARTEARQAWASLRADSDRLIDRVRTRNDPQAKQELLESCRDTQERLQKDKNEFADEVNDVCNRIRDTDVSRTEAWDAIKKRIDELNRDLGG
jgi:hypothetical protein